MIGTSEEKRHKIRIITFNYDTILEYVLERQFSNTEIDYGDFTNHFEIVHPHGKFRPLEPKLLRKPHDEVSDWANSIIVARGPIDDDIVIKERSRARDLVTQCQNLHCAGFAFAGANLKLLGLDTKIRNAHGLAINFCNYNGNVALEKSVSKLDNSRSGVMNAIRVTSDNPPTGRTLSVSDWFASGYAGELPT